MALTSWPGGSAVLSARTTAGKAPTNRRPKAKSNSFFIKPFIDEKRKVLFEAFQDHTISDPDGLMEIKRMLMSLSVLDAEIVNFIDTGKMASQELNKVPMDKH